VSDSDELERVRERYARRPRDDRHGMLQPDVWCALQERQRVTLRLFAKLGWHDLGARRAVEVGCGAGGNLLELLRFGFMPEHLAGVELLPQRLEHARGVLPAAVRLVAGDAVAAAIEPGSQDLVLQFTVFSSLLDDATQARLAAAMWRWVKPGGGVLWYDFTMDNPRNPDVRGMPVSRVRALFPQAAVQAHRVTLAPPLARTVTRVHPALYGWFNALPMLRTHVLCWLAKTQSTSDRD
jgi:SAM-dependent methyltransferase